MSKPISQRPRAEQDIDEVLAYLKQRSPAAALAFLDALERSYGLLSEQPSMGSTRHADYVPGLPVPLRFFPVSNARFPRILIYHLDLPDSVQIIRVWDAARGLEALAEGFVNEDSSEMCGT